MKKTIKLTLGSYDDYTDRTGRIQLCREGMARYFGVDKYDMEHTLWVTVSDKKFKGADKVFMDKEGEVAYDNRRGKGKDYICRDARVVLAKLLRTPLDVDTTLYAKFEVMA